VDLITADRSCGLCVRKSPLARLWTSGLYGGTDTPKEEAATRVAAAGALRLEAFAQGFAGETHTHTQGFAGENALVALTYTLTAYYSHCI